MNCKNCKNQTNNPVFCSSSCSAIWNNKIPKRKRTNFCVFCKKYLKGKQRSGKRKCRDCYIAENIKAFGRKAISEFSSVYARHRYQSIRNHAHKVARLHKLEKYCHVCGYDKKVQLCHKKPISTFPKETELSVVNDINNLVFLCPNHHSELDLGISLNTMDANTPKETRTPVFSLKTSDPSH